MGVLLGLQGAQRFAIDHACGRTARHGTVRCASVRGVCAAPDDQRIVGLVPVTDGKIAPGRNEIALIFDVFAKLRR